MVQTLRDRDKRKRMPNLWAKTETDVPTEIYWCEHCQVPIIRRVNQSGQAECPSCGDKIKYMASDLRPVFPEERLLLELLLKLEPLSLNEKSVWANKNRYYIDGHSKAITGKQYEAADIEQIRKILQEHAQDKYSEAFKYHIQDF